MKEFVSQNPGAMAPAQPDLHRPASPRGVNLGAELFAYYP